MENRWENWPRPNCRKGQRLSTQTRAPPMTPLRTCFQAQGSAFCIAWLLPGALALAAADGDNQPADGRWTARRAAAWYAQQPWLVGCNFLPSTAVNDVEMWQRRHVRPAATIERELGWAAILALIPCGCSSITWCGSDDPAGLQEPVRPVPEHGRDQRKLGHARPPR